MQIESEQSNRPPDRVVIDNHGCLQTPSWGEVTYTPHLITESHLDQWYKLLRSPDIDLRLAQLSTPVPYGGLKSVTPTGVEGIKYKLDQFKFDWNMFRFYSVSDVNREGVYKLDQLGVKNTVCSGTSDEYSELMRQSLSKQGIWRALDSQNPLFMINRRVSDQVWEGRLPMAMTKMSVLERFKRAEGVYPVLWEDRLDILLLAAHFGVNCFSPLSVEETDQKMRHLVPNLPSQLKNPSLRDQIKFGSDVPSIAAWVENQRLKEAAMAEVFARQQLTRQLKELELASEALLELF